MKNQLVIFVFVPIYLLAISVAGCGGDSSTGTMEQLTGKYTLVEFKGSIDGFTLSAKPPDAFGEFVLETGGSSFSLTVVMGPVAGSEDTSYDSWEVYGTSWTANETILEIKEDNDTEYISFEYTWDNGYLTLDRSEDGVGLTMKWRKL